MSEKSSSSSSLVFHRGGKQWFAETETMWPGQQLCLEVKEVLYHEKSEYQDILVFDSTNYGRVLVLDGVIQLTERDEAAYQEMITHIPLFAHPNPKRVLIVGGGDGGVVREVCRHPGIQDIVMCEIDEQVVNVSKRFLGNSTATKFDDPRVQLKHMDAAEYIKDHENSFDVMIVDSSDPVGPAESLYTPEFYQCAHTCLKDDGIICTQGECMWLHLDMIQQVMESAKKIFRVVDYAYTSVPTYPCGQIGFIVASKSDGNLRKPRSPSKEKMHEELNYYSADIHETAFVLPKFAQDKLACIRGVSGDA